MIGYHKRRDAQIMKIIRDAQIVLYMYFYLKHSSSVFFFNSYLSLFNFLDQKLVLEKKIN